MLNRFPSERSKPVRPVFKIGKTTAAHEKYGAGVSAETVIKGNARPLHGTPVGTLTHRLAYTHYRLIVSNGTTVVDYGQFIHRG